MYKYVPTYVDDLCIIAKETELLLQQLQGDPYNFDLKGSGKLNFHLGCGFERDNDGTLAMDPSRYIDKMVKLYERMFGSKPVEKVQSPLERRDHPELDTSEFLDNKGIEHYQSLIGSMQWAISIGIWDFQIAVMRLSSFRAQLWQGHLDQAKQCYSFL